MTQITRNLITKLYHKGRIVTGNNAKSQNPAPPDLVHNTNCFSVDIKQILSFSKQKLEIYLLVKTAYRKNLKSPLETLNIWL